MIEAIGVLASVLVLVSFLFNNTIAIRMVNVLGAAMFVVYGMAIGAFSVWFLNGGLVMVHLFHIVRMMRNARR